MEYFGWALLLLTVVLFLVTLLRGLKGLVLGIAYVLVALFEDRRKDEDK